MTTGSLAEDPYRGFPPTTVVRLVRRIDQDLRLVGQQLLLHDHEYWIGDGCWTCGKPPYQQDCPVEKGRATGSTGHTTIVDMGKAHGIHDHDE
jgi:hypothetical protein